MFLRVASKITYEIIAHFEAFNHANIFEHLVSQIKLTFLLNLQAVFVSRN